MTTILSLQSHVAYGHAGNSSAVFPLQRLGVEVWPVLTVNFSNHTGYGAWRGPTIPADQVWDVVVGVDERGVLGQVDALLTGYQGAPEVGEVVLRTRDLIRERNPSALYCCDPVMGDFGRGFYARPGIPEFMRDEVVPVADVLTPNLFELEFLTGRTTSTLADIVDAAHELRARGPRTVLVTSAFHPGTDHVMRMLAITGEGAWQVETPLIGRTFTGSGDLTTATFLAALLRTGDAAAALSSCASIVQGVLQRTADDDSSELRLVAAQDAIAAPPVVYDATAV